MLSLSVRKEGVHARVIDRLYREKKAAAGNGEDDGIGAGMAWQLCRPFALGYALQLIVNILMVPLFHLSVSCR
jgi:hypothetical protein